MFTTVVGSFDINLKKAETFGDKVKSALGLYDPYKIAVEEVVKFQLDAGLDIVGDGQPRGDMVGSFVSHIPGFSYEMNSSVIVDKIKTPLEYIVLPDLKYAMAVLDKELDKRNLPAEERAKKGVKGIVTGPSTIVHSSRIESFYKDRNPAIIDTAHALRKEIEAINESGAKYIQIDEPFLSTGMVDIGTAKEAISILSEDIDIPVAMHVCGNLSDVFKDLLKFDIDYLDCEFAGNNVNINLLEENADLIGDK
ncbi:MAG: methionine synthase, partial [Methanobrevibacter sp.]|nr:methionine synthase [Methanobrevibacter sp.]